MNNKKTLLAYFGHHKCASTWIKSIIRPVCRELNIKHAIADDPGTFGGKLDLFCKENDIDFLSYLNADIRFVRDIKHYLGFHVIRDPRDIVVSAYFSHLHSHPTDNWPALVGHRKKLQGASKDEGIFLEMEFSKKEFEDLYNWDYSQANVLEFKMEDIIIEPYESMVKAFTYLKMVEEPMSLRRSFVFLLSKAINNVNGKNKGLFPFRISMNNMPVERLLMYIYRMRFSNKSKGRLRGQEDVKNHYRKGVAGDWGNHFNQEHRRFFKDNYNDLLIKLGYEKSSNW